jgi:hypothetical protein
MGSEQSEAPVVGQHHVCGVPGLDHLASARRQSSSTQNTVRSPGPADSPASAAGVAALPEPAASLQRPRAQDLDLSHTSRHRLLPPGSPTPAR